ncbi:mechanosensitive ion channel protein 1, mitochondrial-like [Impatiens glandulifera]|uniref:mechanosensitive ion channel protein 1, mitochondrial-like n=1 Tax=Impatiens glandulifera TaxID=253017 RepID=UPI001FB0A1B3|nr:mechanosensitive ion channel protein 1, mitochondrial-like [Impatiens glandulifera]
MSSLAGMRRFIPKSLSSYVNTFHRQYNLSPPFTTRVSEVYLRASLPYLNSKYHYTDSLRTENHAKNVCEMISARSLVQNQSLGTKNYSSSSRLAFITPNDRKKIGSLMIIPPLLNCRSYSSSEGGGGGVNGSDWVDQIKNASHSTVTYIGDKAKEVSNDLSPYATELLDTYPYLRDVIVPVSGTILATTLSWMVLPRILRRLHMYSSQGPATLLSGTTFWGPAPYEKSFWGALESPVRYVMTFMAFSHIATMVASNIISPDYLVPIWRGALIVSFVWFLHRWKTNVFERALSGPNVSKAIRGKWLIVDNMSSIGLFVIGLLSLADSCGVPVHSIITFGGIGGVATAFAARDVLVNVLSGIFMQASQPFSIGDTIKAGSVEGQVLDIGLTTTSLLSAEKYPITVPNSMFLSQAIVNKSRAHWRAISVKISFSIDDPYKIPQISDEIKNMLMSHPKVFLEKEPPYCSLSGAERYYNELTMGCNLKQMVKYELFLTQQDIMVQSIQILKQHGAKLGDTYDDSNTSHISQSI